VAQDQPCVVSLPPPRVFMSFAKLFLSLLLVFDFEAISCSRVRIKNLEHSLPPLATEHVNGGGLHDLQRERAVASASPSVKHAVPIANADLRRPVEIAAMQSTNAEKSVPVAKRAHGLEQPRISTDVVRPKLVVSSSSGDHLHVDAGPHLSRSFVELHKSVHLALSSLGTSRMKLYVGASSTFAFVGLIVCVCCCCLSAGLRQSSAEDSESESCDDEVGSEEDAGRRRLAKLKHFGAKATTSPALGPALVVTSIKAIKQNVKETASHGSDIHGRDKYKFGDFTRGLAAAGREAQGKDADGKLKIGDVARGLLAKTSPRQRSKSPLPAFLTPQRASTRSRSNSPQ